MSGAATPAPAAGEKPHAVCLPFPAQGHVTPMMNLAKLLHGKGFHVTFVNTEYNHRRLIRSRGPAAVAGLPGFRFATIADGLPLSDADATQDPVSICHSTMTRCLPHFRKLLADLGGAADAGVPPVTCVVVDNVMSFGVDAARELGVPCAVFWAAAACGYLGFRNFRFLQDQGLAPLKDEDQLTNGYLNTPVECAPGMSKHMRLRDFPSFLCTTDPDDMLLNFMMHEVERTDLADAVIINTMDELEQTALDAMRAIALPPIYTIGPLNFLLEQVVPDGAPLSKIRSSLWREDQTCLDWLDDRKPRSVVYVNYGSITTMTNQDLVEFAWCGYEFLWILRNDLIDGDTAVLPPEFVEATNGRCLLAAWCEQLTHCGWNSTMESISSGVPMLCWPFFAEQQTNARYSCVEWGVGMEVDDNVRREVVEARIREVMRSEKGRKMRQRVAEWKAAGIHATQPGGRSLANLENLLEDVLLANYKFA